MNLTVGTGKYECLPNNLIRHFSKGLQREFVLLKIDKIRCKFFEINIIGSPDLRKNAAT